MPITFSLRLVSSLLGLCHILFYGDFYQLSFILDMALFCIDGIILFGKEVATNIDILMTHLTNMLNNSHTKSGAFQISEIFSDLVAGKCQDSAHK